MAELSYKCSKCDRRSSKWLGKCPDCGAYSSFEEVASEKALSNKSGLKTAGAKRPVKRAQSIKELSAKPVKRITTGIGELDRVLGGGFVEAEVVLIGGPPGSGKSTLSLSIARAFADKGMKVLYSSGEESESQIALRAKRMSVSSEGILIVNETQLETILGHIEEEQPDFLIIDSLQTLASSEVSGGIGSIAQGKEASHTLTRVAKDKGIIMLIVNQVLKSGDLAGAESVQHVVDCALIFEADSDSPLKFLRATKNRFGDTSEVGIFQHEDIGIVEVADPSGIFIDSTEAVPGAACTFLSEGVRQIPVEIQALVTRSNLANPRKQFAGVSYQRAQIVCAILDKFCRARLFENDVFSSTVSGVKVDDPQSDLALAAAILSSSRNSPIDPKTTFIGELSLTGQVRGNFAIEAKVKEAVRLGFTTIYVPQSSLPRLARLQGKAKIVGIKSISEMDSLFVKLRPRGERPGGSEDSANSGRRRSVEDD